LDATQNGTPDGEAMGGQIHLGPRLLIPSSLPS
jgi:hypothetical protein